MTLGRPRSGALAALVALAASATSCTETECATPDYTRAECRVLAENGFGRLRTSTGVEVRFQAPSAVDPLAGWTADGLVVERGPSVRARVAHMGDFALSVDNRGPEPTTLELELDNVHPRARVDLDDVEVPHLGAGSKRRISIDLDAGEQRWIRGGLERAAACVSRVRLAVMADVQTNPTQFSRIVDRVQLEAQLAEAEGELLLGAIMPGDLTESSAEDEFRIFTDLLETVSVPFAVTAGNHDVYESHLPFYNQNFGPGNYAFSACGVHVAMLDSGDGAIADSVVGRLPELLDPGDAAWSLMAMHHPPYAELTSAGWSREDLALITLGEFARQGGDLVLAGHAHLLREYEVEVPGGALREIIAGTAGAWQGAGQPIYGYVRLTFEAGSDAIETCFVEVPPPGGPMHTNTTDTGIPVCDTP